MFKSRNNKKKRRMSFTIDLSHNEIIEELKKGNNRYTNDSNSYPSQDATRRTQLQNGQEPPVIVLSCADSRVAPELLFDRGLGELFVVRVAGNIANTSSMASIEYAVAYLKSKVIVVLGHEACGAVNAAIAGGDNGRSLNHLLSHITPSVHACGANATTESVVKENVQRSIKDLVGHSDIIRNAVDNNAVEIIPAYYNLNGEVDFL